MINKLTQSNLTNKQVIQTMNSLNTNPFIFIEGAETGGKHDKEERDQKCNTHKDGEVDSEEELNEQQRTEKRRERIRLFSNSLVSSRNNINSSIDSSVDSVPNWDGRSRSIDTIVILEGDRINQDSLDPSVDKHSLEFYSDYEDSLDNISQ